MSVFAVGEKAKGTQEATEGETGHQERRTRTRRRQSDAEGGRRKLKMKR